MGLPQGYTQLRYIESSGAQYIDTEVSVSPTNAPNLKSVVDKQIISATSYGIDGTGWGQSPYTNSFYIGIDQNKKIAYGNGRTDVVTSTLYDYNRKTFIYDAKAGKISVTGMSDISFTFSAPDSALNFLLFAYKQGTNGMQYYSGRIYSAQLYLNDSCIRDFIPCMDSFGVVGLYDDIGKRFYTNSGTGSFISGPRTSLPSGYTELEYIQSSGTQCINTGFKHNNNTRVVMDAQVVTQPSTHGWLFEGRSSSDSSGFAKGMLLLNGSAWNLDYNGTGNRASASSSVSATDRLNIDYNKNSVTVNTFKKTWTAATFQSTYNLYLLACNTANTISGYVSAKLYSCQIYDNGTLVRDFVPCRNRSGVVCLYDLVSETDYLNAGTEQFTSGGERKTYDISAHRPKSIKTGYVLNIPYTGGSQSITLPAGTYQLECWGAQGGYRSSSTYGGRGGYTRGTITLTNKKTVIYAYAGGEGNNSTPSNSTSTLTPGGFNGGGDRYYYCGGGGASDIRIGADSLYARVIVAAGGGSDGATSKTGMYGGGTTGGSASEAYGTGGGGGTQTAGGSGNTGSFGKGGVGKYASSGYAGAGGGGWYGGGGSTPDSSSDDDRGGGGGSSYVYTSSTTSNYPSGCLLNPSYYLASTTLSAGNASFSDPRGKSGTGNVGNGYVRITAVNVVKQLNGYVMFAGSWREISDAYVLVDGEFKQVSNIIPRIEGDWAVG